MNWTFVEKVVVNNPKVAGFVKVNLGPCYVWIRISHGSKGVFAKLPSGKMEEDGEWVNWVSMNDSQENNKLCAEARKYFEATTNHVVAEEKNDELPF